MRTPSWLFSHIHATQRRCDRENLPRNTNPGADAKTETDGFASLSGCSVDGPTCICWQQFDQTNLSRNLMFFQCFHLFDLVEHFFADGLSPLSRYTWFNNSLFIPHLEKKKKERPGLVCMLELCSLRAREAISGFNWTIFWNGLEVILWRCS